MRNRTQSITLTITRRRVTWGKQSVIFYGHGKSSPVGRGNLLSCLSVALRKKGI